MEKVLNRLIFEGIGCLVFSLIFFISALVTKGSWYEYVFAAGLLLAGSAFIYKSITIKKKLKNKIITKKK